MRNGHFRDNTALKQDVLDFDEILRAFGLKSKADRHEFERKIAGLRRDMGLSIADVRTEARLACTRAEHRITRWTLTVVAVQAVFMLAVVAAMLYLALRYLPSLHSGH
jgi:hypothetical protein